MSIYSSGVAYYLLLFLGFLEGLQPRNDRDILLKELTLVELQKSASYGAAFLGAKAAGSRLNMDFASQYKSFYTLKL